jgi:hypothetical protein
MNRILTILAAIAALALQACASDNSGPVDNSSIAYENVEAVLKNAATDPRSFNEISHTVTPILCDLNTPAPGTVCGYAVHVEFTSTNAWGGPIRQTANLNTDPSGAGLKVVGVYDRDGNLIP